MLTDRHGNDWRAVSSTHTSQQSSSGFRATTTPRAALAIAAGGPANGRRGRSTIHAGPDRTPPGRRSGSWADARAVCNLPVDSCQPEILLGIEDILARRDVGHRAKHEDLGESGGRLPHDIVEGAGNTGGAS